MISTAITNLLAGGTTAAFQTAVSGYTPAEVINVAGQLLQTGAIALSDYRTVLAALVS
jgi:hypothetical protein